MTNALATRSGTRHGAVFSDRKQRIYDFLHTTPVGVLSSTDPDGGPHGAVVYFSVDKQFVVSLLTKTDTRKYDNLMHNDHVMLTVFELQTQTVAQIVGRAAEVKDAREMNAIARKVLRAGAKTSPVALPPIVKLQAGAYVAFKIMPAQVRMAVYARPDPGDYSELFESIEAFELKDVDH